MAKISLLLRSWTTKTFPKVPLPICLINLKSSIWCVSLHSIKSNCERSFSYRERLRCFVSMSYFSSFCIFDEQPYILFIISFPSFISSFVSLNMAPAAYILSNFTSSSYFHLHFFERGC